MEEESLLGRIDSLPPNSTLCHFYFQVKVAGVITLISLNNRGRKVFSN